MTTTDIRFLLWIAPIILALSLAGLSCPEPEDGFNGGDDDDSGGGGDDDDSWPDIGCPNSWRGFGDHPDPDTWDMLVLYAIGGEWFDIGERKLEDYGLVSVKYDEDEDRYEVLENIGLCFSDGGGLFRGPEEHYGGHFYSVSLELDENDGWGGHIQVIPTDGSDPHLLGDPGTLRGLAIVADNAGGFVICGSTSDTGANSLLWVDGTGTEIIEHPLPDGGSCYDVARAWDGTFWVTDTATGRLLNFDLEAGSYYVLADLPGDDLDWVVDEAGNNEVMLGADNIIWVVDGITGEAGHWVGLPDLGITTNHVTNFHWSWSWGVLSYSVVKRDYPSIPYYGPYATNVQGGPDSQGDTFVFSMGTMVSESLVLDYVLLGDLE